MRDESLVPVELDDLLARWEGTTSRRDFLKSSGLFVLSFRVLSEANGGTAREAAAPYLDPDFRQLDSWLVVHEDNTATFYVGKTDGGQGTGTALRQMMCDELDMAFEMTSLVMGRTDLTVDQGGSGGSDAIERDGTPARRVAAEARRVLLEMASQRFGVPVDDLTVSEGVITARGNPSRRITYGELIGGRRFDVTLTGENVNSTSGQAGVKAVQDLKVVGRPIPRYDIPGKVDGTLEWAVDARVPGMVHARNVRPPWAGAKLVSIDESSVEDVPGFIRVVSRGNYVAVVCEREEHAVEAARRLTVRWERPDIPPFPSSEDLFRYLRSEAPMATTTTRGGREVPLARVQGDPEGALSTAARVIEAEYDFPFQGHTAIGPAHALADPSDGQMTLYSNDMKPYRLRTGVAEFLGMPREQVRVIWLEGPQLYGRSAADDAGFEAAFLAKEVGRPVRVQWMRHEETAWDTKGPAFSFTLRGGLDTDGNLVALDYRARVADYAHLGYNQPDTVLIAQLMGIRPARPSSGGGSAPQEEYHIPNRRQETLVVRFPLAFETPLRTGNLRDPNGPQTTFAGESFIDELAAAAQADPVEFRLRLLRGSQDDNATYMRARSIAVVEAAARAYEWGLSALSGALGKRPLSQRTGDRLHWPRADGGRGHRRGRSGPADREGVGEAHGLRPRLRTRHQPGRAHRHGPGEPPPRSESRAPRGGPIRHREGDQCGLDHAPHPPARGRPRADRRRLRERGSEPRPPRPPTLRSGRAFDPSRGRCGRQRRLRRHRRAAQAGPLPRGTCAGGVGGRRGLATKDSSLAPRARLRLPTRTRTMCVP